MIQTSKKEAGPASTVGKRSAYDASDPSSITGGAFSAPLQLDVQP